MRLKKEYWKVQKQNQVNKKSKVSYKLLKNKIEKEKEENAKVGASRQIENCLARCFDRLQMCTKCTRKMALCLSQAFFIVFSLLFGIASTKLSLYLKLTYSVASTLAKSSTLMAF